MQEGNFKNTVVLKNIPSNIIEEAIIVLKENKEAKEEFCLTHNIPISNNQEIIEHIPYKLLESKTNYLNDKNIPLVVNNKMHEIYTMSNKDMNKKYNISLQELLKKYSKTYIKKGS